jgi:hypothetical protein
MTAAHTIIRPALALAPQHWRSTLSTCCSQASQRRLLFVQQSRGVQVFTRALQLGKLTQELACRSAALAEPCEKFTDEGPESGPLIECVCIRLPSSWVASTGRSSCNLPFCGTLHSWVATRLCCNRNSLSVLPCSVLERPGVVRKVGCHLWQRPWARRSRVLCSCAAALDRRLTATPPGAPRCPACKISVKGPVFSAALARFLPADRRLGCLWALQKLPLLFGLCGSTLYPHSSWYANAVIFYSFLAGHRASWREWAPRRLGACTRCRPGGLGRRCCSHC